MKETYEKAIAFVFKYEGGYTNNKADPGGPTNWGITIHDAQAYWKPTATAEDIKEMPKSVADNIYFTHYASPIQYNSLPAGVDFSVLDYAVNSGVSHAVKTLQGIINVPQDGIMGETTLQALLKFNPINVINQMWDERLLYDKALHTWHIFGTGWSRRIKDGKTLALSMVQQTSNPVAKPSLLSNLFNFMKRKSQ